MARCESASREIIMNPSLIFLLQTLVIVALPLAVLRFFGLKGFVPLVVVQIMVGIALGPSLFGRIAPELFHTLFNPVSLSPLSGISSIAVLIFGLITGLHLGSDILRDNGRVFSGVAAANIAVPTALGYLAGLWIIARHPEELPQGVNPAEFALAIGICACATALPVLGAILREMDLLGARIGQFALGVAGIKDAAIWVLLSVLLAARAGQMAGGLLFAVTVVLIPLYVFCMVRFVRPLLGGMVAARMSGETVGERALAIVTVITIASALATEALGLHYIIGAFFTGAIMPDRLRKPILDRLQVLTVVLLMPFFFALTGLRTLIALGSSAFMEIFLAATAVSAVGIVGGTALAARFGGASWPFALGLGSLLQTKGLVELIILTVLMDAGIISPKVFSALILMALVSTALAMPLARLMLAQETAPERS
jgi:Kef-type K+ transport system membrane component KefB